MGLLPGGVREAREELIEGLGVGKHLGGSADVLGLEEEAQEGPGEERGLAGEEAEGAVQLEEEDGGRLEPAGDDGAGELLDDLLLARVAGGALGLVLGVGPEEVKQMGDGLHPGPPSCGLR